MPRGGHGGGSGSRGHKSGHKGQRRHFSNPEDLVAQKEKERREREWRQQRGEGSSDSETEEGKKGSASESDSESSESEGEEQATKAKGVEGMIEIENPNRVVQKTKKISQLDGLEASKPELSRREREEVDKQQAKANYLRMHAAGKTDDARADLARLAIIKKQRADAAKKREEDKKAKEASAQAKTDSMNKALGKNRKT